MGSSDLPYTALSMKQIVRLSHLRRFAAVAAGMLLNTKRAGGKSEKYRTKSFRVETKLLYFCTLGENLEIL